MALLIIGGVEMPSPSSMSVGIQDISKAERNARGTMIIERIATKNKIELSWSYLTESQMAQVLTAVSAVFFNVTYKHPRSNSIQTSTFYVGDRNVPIMDAKDGVIRYKDLKMNFIER